MRVSTARRASRMYAFAAFACLALVACAQLQPAPEPPTAARPDVAVPKPPPQQAAPLPPSEPGGASQQRGRISLYGARFAGKPTASGDIFDPELLTMAHRSLPFGTRVRVTNLENRKSVEVVVNDRGPFVDGRIADLSAAAARQIGMTLDGVVDGLLEILRPVKGR